MATKKATRKTRVKNSTPLPLPCSGWNEADDYVRRLGVLHRQIKAKELRAANKITAIKEALKIETADDLAATKLLVFSLDQFAATHVGDFKTARSKKLNHGKLGWRKATSIKIATKKGAGTLEKIKEFFSPALRKVCLTVKVSVNKEALHTLTDEQLSQVAARRTVTDDFFVEPTIVNAVDTTEDLGDG